MRMLFPLLLTLLNGAHAATLAECRAVADTGARLNCYDALPLPSAVLQRETAPARVAAAPVADAAPGGSFGLATRGDAQPKFIESRIAGQFDGWSRGGTIKLENGQVWQVDDEGAVGYKLESPKVRVTQGMMGAHFLEIEGVNFSPRVKRVQ